MRTRQEMADFVVEKLAQQGFKQSMNAAGCAYRGTDGMKCAIGHLIPDEQYDSSIENVACYYLPPKLLEYCVCKGDICPCLANSLQVAHDNGFTSETMIQQLKHTYSMYAINTDKFDQIVHEFRSKVSNEQ